MLEKSTVNSMTNRTNIRFGLYNELKKFLEGKAINQETQRESLLKLRGINYFRTRCNSIYSLGPLREGGKNKFLG